MLPIHNRRADTRMNGPQRPVSVVIDEFHPKHGLRKVLSIHADPATCRVCPTAMTIFRLFLFFHRVDAKVPVFRQGALESSFLYLVIRAFSVKQEL